MHHQPFLSSPLRSQILEEGWLCSSLFKTNSSKDETLFLVASFSLLYVVEVICILHCSLS